MITNFICKCATYLSSQEFNIVCISSLLVRQIPTKYDRMTVIIAIYTSNCVSLIL
jgi:hypothetical protein